MKDLQDKAAAMTPEDAALRAVDQDALLEGEDPASPHVDDAEHWISVYRELIEFKASVLGASAGEIADLDHKESRSEAKQVDVPILRAELERFRRRLAFWQARLEQLRSEGRT